MRGWEAKRRGVSASKKRNTGCVWCGRPETRTIWVLGAGRVSCCDECHKAKMTTPSREGI